MESLSNQTDHDGLTIRRVPIESLHLDPANARAHGEENMEAIAASLQRFGQADEVARAAVFLASSDSSYMTGSEVTVDGGFAQV